MYHIHININEDKYLLAVALSDDLYKRNYKHVSGSCNFKVQVRENSLVRRIDYEESL